LIILTGLLTGGACNSKGQLSGTGGTGNSPSDAGTPITTCPLSAPATMTLLCMGSLGCSYQAGCTCHGCCSSFWSCVDGVFKQTDFNDGCIQGPTCPDGGGGAGTSGGDAGTGGVSGSTGGTGGSSGGAGGTSGAAGGGAGGAPITSCPASSPMVTRYAVGPACDGTFSCSYNDMCRCGVCCLSIYQCQNGHLQFYASGDACLMVTCDAGPGPTDAPPACTAGADQSCNDNPAISSIHGHCTDAGVCECGTFGTNPVTGRCL
jgi:hypothetical protein